MSSYAKNTARPSTASVAQVEDPSGTDTHDPFDGNAGSPESGGADLGAVEEIDFVVGTDPAKVKLQVDPENQGDGVVSLFPTGGGTRAMMAIYNYGLLPDGSSVGDSRAPHIEAVANPGGANVGVWTWTAQASAVLDVGGVGTDDAPMRGSLTIRKDDDADSTGYAIQIPGVLTVNYDGSVILQAAGAGVRFRSPDGSTTKTLSIDNSGDPVWT